MAEIPTGSFNVLGEELSILSAPSTTRRQLLRFQELLERARKTGKSFEELQRDVKREAPEFSDMLARLWKKRPNNAFVIATSLSAISLVLQINAREPLDEEQTSRAVKQGVQAALQEERRALPPIRLVTPRGIPEIGKDAPDPEVSRDDGNASQGVGQDKPEDKGKSGQPNEQPNGAFNSPSIGT